MARWRYWIGSRPKWEMLFYSEKPIYRMSKGFIDMWIVMGLTLGAIAGYILIMFFIEKVGL